MKKNLISLLCRKKTNYYNDLKNTLNIFYDTIIIEDNNKDFEDCVKKNFINLVTIKEDPSAWELAFFNIFNNKLYDKYDYFYFIEDDVYSKNIETFKIFIKKLENIEHDLVSSYITKKSEMINWYYWEKQNTSMFNEEDLFFSFNPICRISKNLIGEILKFQSNNNQFIFHEILFSSICKKNKLNMMSLTDDPEIKSLIGNIIYRPIINKNSILDNRIYHPVKNLE